MMLRLLSVGACAMTAIAFATMKKERLGGYISVEGENAGVSDGECDCLVNIGPNSLFHPNYLTPGKVWGSKSVYSSFNTLWKECFDPDAGIDYADCAGDKGENLFRSYACGDYSVTGSESYHANGVAPSNYADGKDYFDALTTRDLPGRPTNELLESYIGDEENEDEQKQVSLYTFCNGFGASTGLPPAPPTEPPFSNFACNKIIDNKMYEAANYATTLGSKSLQMPNEVYDCAVYLATFDTSVDSATLCGLLWKKDWILSEGTYLEAAKFCLMSAKDDGTMGCQFTDKYITEGCFTTRAPSAPPARRS